MQKYLKTAKRKILKSSFRIETLGMKFQMAEFSRYICLFFKIKVQNFVFFKTLRLYQIKVIYQ